MKGEIWLPGEQGGREGFGLRREGAQGQCFAAGIGGDGDAVMDGGTDELIKRSAGLEVEEGVVGVTNEKALSFQQPGDLPADAVQQLSEFRGRRPSVR